MNVKWHLVCTGGLKNKPLKFWTLCYGRMLTIRSAQIKLAREFEPYLVPKRSHFLSFATFAMPPSINK